MGRLIANLVTWGLLFLSLGTIGQITYELATGAANARAKGKLIGRKKLRDSEMIRKLLAKGLTYRAISELCSCSHGSVHQEKLAWKKEEKQKEEERIKLEANKASEVAEKLEKHGLTPAIDEGPVTLF